MANIKSAIKRIDVNNKNKIRNKANKTKLKTQTKKFLGLIEKGEVQEAEKALPATFAVIDKSATKGAIHKNAACRKKASLSKKLDDAKNGKGVVVETKPAKTKKVAEIAEVESKPVVEKKPAPKKTTTAKKTTTKKTV